MGCDPSAAVWVRAAFERRFAAGELGIARPGSLGVVADRDPSCRVRSALRDDETVDTAVANEEGDMVIAQVGAAPAGDDRRAADVDEVLFSRRERFFVVAQGLVAEHSLDLGGRIAYTDATVGAAKLVDGCWSRLSATPL
jgi:hypothetical protein